MDVDLPAEHALLRSTVRTFMETEVAPVIEAHEDARRFPKQVVERLGRMGWLGIPIPAEDGGAGMDFLAYVVAIEEMGRVWASLALIVAAHTGLACGALQLAGTKEQRTAISHPHGLGACIGCLRPDRIRGGLRCWRDPDDRDVGTRFREGWGWWVLHGRKRFITNAGQAQTYIVTARTGTTDNGRPEISAFIVESDRPGFSVGRIEKKLGVHASATGELLLDGVRVPETHLLGRRRGWTSFVLERA